MPRAGERVVIETLEKLGCAAVLRFGAVKRGGRGPPGELARLAERRISGPEGASGPEFQLILLAPLARAGQPGPWKDWQRAPLVPLFRGAAPFANDQYH